MSATLYAALKPLRRRRAPLTRDLTSGERHALLLTWLINAVALIALPYVFSSITVDTFLTALIVALVLGLINTLIRPGPRSC